jgi:hypothetical protein
MTANPSEAAEPPRPFSRGQLRLLLVITLIGAAARLFRLGDWSLWVDEAHTFRDVMKSPADFWDSQNARYPLSYLFLRELMPLFESRSEGWLRLPFVFFGILSVPSLALVGRLMIGPRAALLGALLLALSPWHVYWSQNVRSYSMVLFFCLWGAGLFYLALERGSWWLLLATLAVTVVAGLCHPSAYLMLGAYLLYTLLSGWRHGIRLSKWTPLWIVGVALALSPVLLPVLETVVRNKPEVSSVHLAQTAVWFLRVPLIAAACGGVLWLLDRGERSGAFLLTWMSMPLLALQIASMGFSKMTAQYAFYTLPAFCLAAAALVDGLLLGIAASGIRGWLLRGVPLGLLLLDMGGGLYLYFTRQYGDRPRWREASDYVARQSGPKLRVLTTNGPSMLYYLDRDQFVGDHAPGSAEVLGLADYVIEEGGGASAFFDAEIARAQRDGVTLWVVVTEPELEEMDRRRIASDEMRQRFHQVRSLPNWNGPKDMTVLIYRLLAPR